MAQVPVRHTALAWAGSQPRPQPPQWARLLPVSTHEALHSIGASAGQLAAQEAEPAATTQRGVGSEQVITQSPQLPAEVRSPSQPSFGSPLQSDQPSSHTSEQLEATHDAVACASPHTIPQAPQWVGSPVRSKSSSIDPSQSSSRPLQSSASGTQGPTPLSEPGSSRQPRSILHHSVEPHAPSTGTCRQ